MQKLLKNSLKLLVLLLKSSNLFDYLSHKEVLFYTSFLLQNDKKFAIMDLEVKMKKVFIAISILVLFTSSMALTSQRYDDGFIVRFTHCLPSSIMLKIPNENGDISISRQIIGWDNKYRCRYSEKSTQNGKTEAFSCNFVRKQINELVSAMKSDPNGDSTAQSSWDMYKNNPNVCTLSQ